MSTYGHVEEYWDHLIDLFGLYTSYKRYGVDELLGALLRDVRKSM